MNKPPKPDAGSIAETLNRLAFFATPRHPCSYLADRMAVTLFADPCASLSTSAYSYLAPFGFRRSGSHVYRPACPGCHACVPVRVPSDAFRPRRSQRRVWRRNQDLTVHSVAPEYRPEQHELYCRYVQQRHPGGGMDEPDPDKYMEFLTSTWSATEFIEFRDNGRLLAVAVVDVLDDALSAVYTFFDPEQARRSLGTFAILWEIELARQRCLPWLYLGFWIRESTKMGYKEQFLPQERRYDDRWERIEG